MKNEYEVIGKAIEEILTSELSDFLDQIMLSHRLKEEYKRISSTDAPVELKRLYESAIELVGVPTFSESKVRTPTAVSA